MSPNAGEGVLVNFASFKFPEWDLNPQPSDSEDLNRVKGQHSMVLHRVKRRWITAVFKLVEEDTGPFPKQIIKLSNDKIQNHTVVFRLSGEGVDREPERGLFSIDSDTGDISVHHKVDRETTRKITFQVDALNKDSYEILDDHMLYVIVVTDINDNPPKFSSKTYKVDISENTRPGEEIFRAEAKDDDDEATKNAKILYSIVSQTPLVPSNMFEINSENGFIYLRGCLDQEVTNSYTLVIKARDNGQNILSSSTEVQINVRDSNNNPPTFIQKSASVTINETDKGMVLLRVSVTDKDTPNTPAWRAKYKIVEGNDNENCKIETDPETNDGILYLVKSLDYEHGAQRKIRITAENEEPLFICPGNISEVLPYFIAIVTVTDTNDPPMFFPPILIAHEMEGQEPGKILGRFNATDSDKFHKHSFRYVRGLDPAEWITVNSETGVVKTVKQLDRESTYVIDNAYTFTVYAIDDDEIPNTGTGTMSLFLIDINDNLPYLTTSYQEMCDDGEVSSVTVAAEDDDQEPYSGPFKIELLDNEQSIKDMWKLGKTTDSTVQLVRKKQIPIGNYNVPFKIQDRQGIAQETSLNLRVCHCLDGTCPSATPRATVLGGAAIGLLLAGFLLLLLALCLLLFCIFAKKKFNCSLPYNEPTWTLVKYNEEGGNADSQTPPTIQSFPLMSSDAGLGAEYISNVRKDVQEMYRKEDLDADNEIAGYEPRVYCYEEEERYVPSLDSISMLEDCTGFDYLNDMGPRFTTLARICQEKYPQ
uniref:cadherin-like protein 26 n=1 Tax=Pristiophorus japonicus TaxID=55135 RepID=UPI00398F7B1E